jgi:hypothetical protein
VFLHVVARQFRCLKIALSIAREDCHPNGASHAAGVCLNDMLNNPRGKKSRVAYGWRSTSAESVNHKAEEWISKLLPTPQRDKKVVRVQQHRLERAPHPEDAALVSVVEIERHQRAQVCFLQIGPGLSK